MSNDAIVKDTIATKTIAIEVFVIATLMRELVQDRHSPSAFLVYLFLYGNAREAGHWTVSASHQFIADKTGLSKSSVQGAIRLLRKHHFLRSKKESKTATPDHEVLRPWL